MYCFQRLLFTAVEWLCFNSPMLWCTDDTICKLFFHLTALDVTFMWLVLNSGRHLCFETCSINGTTLNYSVNTACFFSFSFFHSLYVHISSLRILFCFSWTFLSAICFHILKTSKKCLTSILVSIFIIKHLSFWFYWFLHVQVFLLMVQEYQVYGVKFIVSITHVIVVFSLYRCSLLLFINI